MNQPAGLQPLALGPQAPLSLCLDDKLGLSVQSPCPCRENRQDQPSIIQKANKAGQHGVSYHTHPTIETHACATTTKPRSTLQEHCLSTWNRASFPLWDPQCDWGLLLANLSLSPGTSQLRAQSDAMGLRGPKVERHWAWQKPHEEERPLLLPVSQMPDMMSPCFNNWLCQKIFSLPHVTWLATQFLELAPPCPYQEQVTLCIAL